MKTLNEDDNVLRNVLGIIKEVQKDKTLIEPLEKIEGLLNLDDIKWTVENNQTGEYNDLSKEVLETIVDRGKGIYRVERSVAPLIEEVDALNDMYVNYIHCYRSDIDDQEEAIERALNAIKQEIEEIFWCTGYIEECLMTEGE